jgi:hypothetical protein
MARRSMQKRPSKLKPIERTYLFEIPVGDSYLDSGFVLSFMNRQMMKQGMEYIIESIELFGAPDNEISVSVQSLSKNWISTNSWVKGFAHWKDQQDEFLREAGQESRKAAYNDFKIYYDIDHTDSNSLLPANTVTVLGAGATDPSVRHAWIYSEVVVPNDGGIAGNTNEYNLHMLGPDDAGSDRKGLITNYALSRSRPEAQDPNQVAPSNDGGLYQDMVDVGETLEDVGENVTTHNFSPPYLVGDLSTFEWYPGGANNPLAGTSTRDILTVRGGTSGFNTDSMGAFSALAGLVKFQNTGDSPVVVRVTWAAGEYKGIMARPMQDVN